MNIRTGQMFDHLNEYQYMLITTNSYIDRFGDLAMGRGAALDAKELDPTLPGLFGNVITATCGHLGTYHLMIGDLYPHANFRWGAFQVKRHFKDHASFALIQASTLALSLIAEAQPDKRIALNFPGIGYGGLKRNLVDPLIESLPSNVDIWLKAKEPTHA